MTPADSPGRAGRHADHSLDRHVVVDGAHHRRRTADHEPDRHRPGHPTGRRRFRGDIQYLRGSTQILPVYNGQGPRSGRRLPELDVVANEGFNVNSFTNNFGVTAPTSRTARTSTPSGTQPRPVLPPSSTSPSTSPRPGRRHNFRGALWPRPMGHPHYKFTPASPCVPPASGSPDVNVRTTADYHALSTQVDPVFTYWTFQPGATTTSTTIATPNIPPGSSNFRQSGRRVSFRSAPWHGSRQSVFT